jgi:c-di-GMP-binding flagellar brake protein YcgR
MDKTVRVNIKCRCGHAFHAVLEKRRRYRKRTRLPGTYTYERPDRTEDKGIMEVVDISSSGLKLKLNVGRAFKVGDKIQVEFNLDNPQRTPIEKVVTVKNVSKNFVGVAFNEREGEDPSLGFYLLK